MSTEDALLQKQREQALLDATKFAALSGGIGGAGLGAASALISGKKRLAEFAKSALLGSLATGSLSGGSIYSGGQILGPASLPGDYTRMGTVGGGLGGGLIGGALGGFFGAGGGNILKKSAELLPNRFAQGATDTLKSQSDNLIGEYYKNLAKGPKGPGALKGALAGAALLGGAAGFLGSDEGMQLDYLDSEISRVRK